MTPTEFDGEFVTRTMPRIDYNALREAAAAVDKANALPDALPDDYAKDETLMKQVCTRRAVERASVCAQLHHLLMEIDVVEGELVCPETNRQFPISNGIPNMLAREDEVE